MAVVSGVPQLSGSIAPGYSEYSALMAAPASRQSAALSLPVSSRRITQCRG